MLAQARNRVFRNAADRGRGKQLVIGQQEQERADHQQPAAREAQRGYQPYTLVLALPQQLAALLFGGREADDILFWLRGLLFAHVKYSASSLYRVLGEKM